MSTVEIRTTGRRPGHGPISTAALRSNGSGNGGEDSINSKGFVLVVDDEPDIRELIEDTLGFFGYQTTSAGDGDEAMQKIRASRPDVITLDLAMPRRDGHSLIREMSADPTTHNIPIVVISAYAGNLCRTAQIVRVLWKPFDVDDLLYSVDLAVAGRGRRL